MLLKSSFSLNFVQKMVIYNRFLKIMLCVGWGMQGKSGEEYNLFGVEFRPSELFNADRKLSSALNSSQKIKKNPKLYPNKT